jgi:hypothetical protein
LIHAWNGDDPKPDAAEDVRRAVGLRTVGRVAAAREAWVAVSLAAAARAAGEAVLGA